MSGNVEFFKKQIESMDVKSGEFFELYSFISDKYYKFPQPDDFQQAVMNLRIYLDKACGNYEQNVIVMHQLMMNLFNMDKDKTKACMGMLGFKEKDYFFTIATDKKEIKKMQKMMGKVLKGNFSVKDGK